MREIQGERLVKKKKQLHFIRPAQMALFARVVSWPPLGQVTIVPHEQRQVRFIVSLESSKSLPEEEWEISVWHNINGADWEDLPLEKQSSGVFNVSSATKQRSYRYTFSGAISSPQYSSRPCAFTLKYRTQPSAQSSSWQWTNQNFGISDGTLIFQTSPINYVAADDSPATFILGPDFKAERFSCDAPGAELWEIKSKFHLPPVTSGDAPTEHRILGIPKDVLRWFSLVRIWSPWLAPRHGTTKLQLSEDALLCSFLDGNGIHTVILAVNGTDDTLALFNSDDDGNVIMSARNDGTATVQMRSLMASAHSFDVANAAVMYAARRILTSALPHPTPESTEQHFRTNSLDDNTVLISKEDKAKPNWFENWYDGLAYCTWNGLGQNLSEEKILDALKSLDKEDVHVSNLIIDDNWQSLDGTPDTNQMQRGWADFEANQEGFPNGLKQTTSLVRSKHPYVKHIGVWHALLGYWGGISPSGTIAKSYKTKSVRKTDRWAGGTMLAVDPSDAHRLYDDFYSFLSSSGIDSVKTDAQFFLDLLTTTEDRRRFTTTYQDAWTIAHLKHLSARAISCMSQIPQIMFHSLLPRNTPTILIRNSDDFFPDVPTSHPWHVFCNAHNALFVQYLNVVPDWDMFQTAHPYGAFHGAARCVSGGAVYITDTPGEHDIPLIRAMTAKAPRGQTVILRPSCIGKTIDIYNNYNEGHLLKIGAYNGAAKTGTGILGCFNISEKEVSALVALRDFPGVESEESYVITSYLTGQVSHAMIALPKDQPESPDQLVPLTLSSKGYDILTAYPLHSFPQENGTSSVSVALLGLLGKLTGAAALMNCDLFLASPIRLQMDISLKALGTLGVYVSDLQSRNDKEDFMAIMGGKGVPEEYVKSGVDGEDGKGGVLEIDVEGAWRELGLEVGWGNEVDVQIFMKV